MSSLMCINVKNVLSFSYKVIKLDMWGLATTATI